MTIQDDVVRRTIGRVIEAMDDVRPVNPYSKAQVIRKAAGEPGVAPMLDALKVLDRRHQGWNLEDHLLRYMSTCAGGILRGTDARGRRTHGRIQVRANEPARWFSILVFTLEQIQAMRIGGRRYERHVKLRNDGFEQLERLMTERGATKVAEVWDDWRPEPHTERGEAV